MWQLQNNTPFAVQNTFFPNEEAIDTLYIVARATFNIGKQWTLANDQLPPIAADEYWTEPGKSSIKHASDYHIGKPCSDIIMLGHAFVPKGQEARQLDVNLKVGQVAKTVRVFGDRQWLDGRITQARPFKTMAMVYEKAYGGVHILDGQITAVEKRNPVGRGFAGQRNTKEMDGVQLPNLEDPDNLINDIQHQPVPACFGVSAPHWSPRSDYAGTYDEAWQTKRAPYLPKDFDKRFFSMAHPDLIYPGYLKGGESVEITHMHSNGSVKFSVPNVKLNLDIRMADKRFNPTFNLETLIIEPNQLRASLVWRATLQCDKKMLQISDIKITMIK